jgi:hypothetical protein
MGNIPLGLSDVRLRNEVTGERKLIRGEEMKRSAKFQTT